MLLNVHILPSTSNYLAPTTISSKKLMYFYISNSEQYMMTLKTGCLQKQPPNESQCAVVVTLKLGCERPGLNHQSAVQAYWVTFRELNVFSLPYLSWGRKDGGWEDRESGNAQTVHLIATVPSLRFLLFYALCLSVACTLNKIITSTII